VACSGVAWLAVTCSAVVCSGSGAVACGANLWA